MDFSAEPLPKRDFIYERSGDIMRETSVKFAYSIGKTAGRLARFGTDSKPAAIRNLN